MTKDVIKDAIRQWRLDKGRWPIQKEIAEERGVSVDGIRVALKREDPPTDFTRLRDEVKTELKGRDSD